MFVYNVPNLQELKAEDAVELRDLLMNPGTVPFSRLKYLGRIAGDEQVVEFSNG